jgi:hypothetical protein
VRLADFPRRLTVVAATPVRRMRGIGPLTLGVILFIALLLGGVRLRFLTILGHRSFLQKTERPWF